MEARLERHGIILGPSGRGFDADAVLNPGCVLVDGAVHMLYRGVHADNRSALGYCRLHDGLQVTERRVEPVLTPVRSYERHGLEDPRLVLLDGRYHVFYVAYDGSDTCVCYATTADFLTYDRRGIITPLVDCDDMNRILRRHGLGPRARSIHTLNCPAPWTGRTLVWDKDGFAFPRRVNGKVIFLHRLRPSIQMTFCDDLQELVHAESWERELGHLETSTLLAPKKNGFEGGYVGGGCPPLETEDGWLLVYHAVQYTPTGPVYRAGVALLDRRRPRRVLSRLHRPLVEPIESYERRGYVSNVVFPTGAVTRNDRLFIYYGAADTAVACASVPVETLLAELRQSANRVD